MTLLYGRHHYFLQSVDPHLLAFRKLTVQERQFIDTNLGGLLYHPLDSVDHFRRSDSKVETSLPLTLLRHFLQNLIIAMMGCDHRHLRPIETSYAIHQEKLIATLQAKHAKSMKCLILRQFFLLRSFRNVEESDFLHCCDLLEDCSGWNTNANDTATISAKAAKIYQLVVQSPTR